LLGFGLFCTSGLARANGFQLPEAGTRAMGMNNAFVAVADDASALWYNPAGLAFLEGGHLMLGGVGIIVPGTKFTANSSNTAFAVGTTARSDRKNFLIPHLHVALTDPKMGVSYGLSVTSPFGLETDWTGTVLATSTAPFSLKSVTFSRIELFNINPNIAFKITDHIAIGGGFDYVYMKDVDFNTSILTQNADGDGWGGNVSLMYKDEMFSVGVSYRTQVAIRVTGTASSTLGGKATAVSGVKLPDMVNAGFAFRPTKTLLISAEADWTNWSKFDRLLFNYSSPLTVPVKGGITTSVTEEEWHPTVTARVGVEWRAQDRLRLRVGYAYDPSPVNDKNFSPGIPVNDRHLISAGAGYDFTKNLTVDVAYMYLKQKDLHQTASTSVAALRNGLYEGSAHLAAMSMRYRF
jgi:Long-chain fatty acid transport protein